MNANIQQVIEEMNSNFEAEKKLFEEYGSLEKVIDAIVARITNSSGMIIALGSGSVINTLIAAIVQNEKKIAKSNCGFISTQSSDVKILRETGLKSEWCQKIWDLPSIDWYFETVNCIVESDGAPTVYLKDSPTFKYVNSLRKKSRITYLFSQNAVRTEAPKSIQIEVENNTNGYKLYKHLKQKNPQAFALRATLNNFFDRIIINWRPDIGLNDIFMKSDSDSNAEDSSEPVSWSWQTLATELSKLPALMEHNLFCSKKDVFIEVPVNDSTGTYRKLFDRIKVE